MSLLEAVSSIVLHRSRCNLRKDGDTGRKELIAVSRLVEGNLTSVSEGSGPYLIGRYANVTMAIGKDGKVDIWATVSGSRCGRLHVVATLATHLAVECISTSGCSPEEKCCPRMRLSV